MRFFVDTANLDHIREAVMAGSISGITINPVILVKETLDYESHAKSVLQMVPDDWDVSLEVRSASTDDMIEQARVLASWDSKVRVKLPTTVDGLKAASALIEHIPLNMTIVKTSAQAMMVMALAERAKCPNVVVSIFCGRLRQVGYDWQEAVGTLSKMGGNTKILAASIKTPTDLSEAISAGADIITAPLDVYQMILANPLVDEDVFSFNQAFDKQGLRVPGSGAVS